MQNDREKIYSSRCIDMVSIKNVHEMNSYNYLEGLQNFLNCFCNLGDIISSGDGYCKSIVAKEKVVKVQATVTFVCNKDIFSQNEGRFQSCMAARHSN